MFGAGNGRVAEVIAQWLADLDFAPKNLHHADALDFTAALAPFFPRNVQFKTLVSHLAWEHLRRWSGAATAAAAAAGGVGRSSLLSHLTNAHLCLKSISHEAFARNLTILAYKTFLEKVMIHAVWFIRNTYSSGNVRNA